MSPSVERVSPDVIKVKLTGRVNSKEWRAALADVAKGLNPRNDALRRERLPEIRMECSAPEDRARQWQTS